MSAGRIQRIVACCVALMLCVVSVASANVSKGDKGSEVSSIQQRLVDLGYLTGKVDGSFGNMTEQAVKDFQKAMGLPETGEVDSTTQSILYDPNIHAPFFQKAIVQMTSTFEENEAGKNTNGKRVDWVINIIIPKESWMDEVTCQCTHSWTDQTVDVINDITAVPAWNNAKKGTTSHRDFWGYTDTGEACYHTVYLPDDPAISGRNWIEMECMGDKAIVYFTLEYKGDYINGSGWKIKDVSIENKASSKTQNDKTANQNDGLLSPEIALNNLIIWDGCGWPTDSANPEFGCNENGDEIVYGITVFIEQASKEVVLTSVSWTDEIQPDDGMLHNWELAKKGYTTMLQSYSEFSQTDGSTVTQNTIDIYLPDNPAIAGEQWFTLTCDNQRALVRVKLTYLGNYETGKGWEIEHLGTTVNQIGQ